jgi:hypothetical protein
MKHSTEIKCYQRKRARFNTIQAREKHPHFEDKMFAMETAAYTELQWRHLPMLNCVVEAVAYTELCSGGSSLY